MRGRYDVVGMGVCACDLVIEVEQYPDCDEKVRASRVRQLGGGLVGTALVAVARLGGSCAYLGALGDDSFGDFCVQDFENEGVDTALIRRAEGKSVVLAIVVADRSAGTRMIMWTDENAPLLAPDQISEDQVSRARVLHVDNFFPQQALPGMRLARSLGVPVTMDLEIEDGQVEDFLALGDYAIVPLHLVAARYGVADPARGVQELFRELRQGGGRAAVVTAGPRGSWGMSEKGQIYQPAYRVDVVDTTGCGDVYHGAFALAVARGWSVERGMRYAAATAALKCRKLGGRPGIPTAAEVDSFLQTAKPIE